MSEQTQALCAFILARVSEVEKDATGATPGNWKLWGMQVRADAGGDSDYDKSLPVCTTYSQGPRLRTFNANHIARNDPEQVMRQCAFDRQMVQYASVWVHDQPDGTYTLMMAQACWLEVLQPLAKIYDRHPDYQQEWEQMKP